MEGRQIEKEIGLIGLAKLMIKRRYILLFSVVSFISLACVVVLVPPKIYELSMLVDTEGTLYNLDDFITKIKEGSFNDRVLRDIKLDPFSEKISFTALYPKGFKIVKITTKKLRKDRDLGLKELQSLYQEIYRENEKNIDLKLSTMDRKDSPFIGSYNNMIMFNKNEIKAKEERLLIIDEEIKVIEERLPVLEGGYKKVSKQNEEYIMKKVDADRGLSDKLSNLIQRNTELLNRNYNLMEKIRSNITSLKTEKNSIMSSIRSMNLENEKLMIEISKINLPKDRADYKSTVLLRAPYVANVQTTLKKSIKIAVSAAIGFLLGIFFILILELFSKAKSELDNEILEK